MCGHWVKVEPKTLPGEFRMGCHQGPWDGGMVRGPLAVMWTGQQKTNEEAGKRNREVGGGRGSGARGPALACS